MISEIVKHRLNRVETRGLSFYRERNGAEADLVIEGSDGLTLVEVKAAATPASSLFRGAQRVRRHFADPARPDATLPEVVVVYGGSELQERSAGRLVPWQHAGAVSFP